jgi:hypothetical protein
MGEAHVNQREIVLYEKVGNRHTPIIVLYEKVNYFYRPVKIEFLYCESDRISDLEDVFKATLESLTHAGIFEHDPQIDELTIKRSATPNTLQVRMEIMK